MKELAPNIHWLKTSSVNCYLCVDEDSLILIDAASPNQMDIIFNYVERIGYRPINIRHILLTHADIDHVGSLYDIWDATGATIYASLETSEHIKTGKGPQHLPRPMQFILNTFMKTTPVPPKATIKPIKDGETLPLFDGIEVFATPGHTPDHLSFYHHASGTLFAGDALDTRGDRIGLLPKLITGDWEQARQSARRILGLSPAIFACGHGTPMDSHEMGDVMMLLQQLKAN